MREGRMKWEEIIPNCEINHLLILWILKRDGPPEHTISPPNVESLTQASKISELHQQAEWAWLSAQFAWPTAVLCECCPRAAVGLCCPHPSPSRWASSSSLLRTTAGSGTEHSVVVERHNRLQFPNSHQESHSKINECCDVYWLHAWPSKIWTNGCEITSRDAGGGRSFFRVFFKLCLQKTSLYGYHWRKCSVFIWFI